MLDSIWPEGSGGDKPLSAPNVIVARAGTPSAIKTWTSSQGSCKRAASSASESCLRLVQS